MTAGLILLTPVLTTRLALHEAWRHALDAGDLCQRSGPPSRFVYCAGITAYGVSGSGRGGGLESGPACSASGEAAGLTMAVPTRCVKAWMVA